MGRRGRLFVALLGAVSLSVASCLPPETPVPLPTAVPTSPPADGGGETQPSPPSTPLIAPTGEQATPSSPEAAPTSNPSAPLQLAVDLLAAELGISPEGIEVISALPVQWNDASLGCPQPDQAYPPVITPGYLITLSVAGETYNVHTDLSGLAVVCEADQDPIGSGTVPDPIVAEFIAQARADLAHRLNVPVDQVVLVRSEAVDWPDSSLGCAQPGEEVVQAVTAGYRIVLAVGEAFYEYHTDQQRMILCETSAG